MRIIFPWWLFRSDKIELADMMMSIIWAEIYNSIILTPKAGLRSVSKDVGVILRLRVYPTSNNKQDVLEPYPSSHITRCAVGIEL